jgi:glycine cleavage system H protein
MAQLRFSGAHVWVRVEGDQAVLGLSDYLQDQMGEITALELPDLGDILRARKRMGHVESEDASSPIEAPITGEECLHVLRTIFAFYEAVKTGRTQNV